MTLTTTDPRIKQVKYITKEDAAQDNINWNVIADAQDIKTILAKLDLILDKLKINDEEKY